MSFISSGINKGKKFRLGNKAEKWLASALRNAPNQRVFGFFVTEDGNSESEGEAKNNDKPDNDEGISPGEETSDGDNFSKNKLDIPVEHRTCTCENRGEPKSKNGRCRFCGFDLAHVKLPSHTWTFHGVPNSVESTSKSHPSTFAKSSKQNPQQGNENKRKKRKRKADKGNLKTGCWECELCSSKFTRLFNLNKHYRNDHEITLRFSCGKCDKLFRYINNYKFHLRGHSDVETEGNRGNTKRPHDDDDGDDGNENEQSQSKKSKQESRFKCHICDERFSESWELREHTRTKHGLGQNFFKSPINPRRPFGPSGKKK